MNVAGRWMCTVRRMVQHAPITLTACKLHGLLYHVPLLFIMYAYPLSKRYLSVGTIRVPRTPKEFTGFQGPIVHTADWDSSVDFTNKRVAVVGSGASAVQAVPRLQKQAAHLVSYQRSPAWVRLRQQYHYSKLKKFLFRWIPLLLLLHRWYIYWAVSKKITIRGYMDVGVKHHYLG